MSRHLAAAAIVAALLTLAAAAPASDCNRNGRADAVDISSGASADCDANAVPDECEVPHLVLATGTTIALPEAAGGLAAADFDGDGAIDLATVLSSGTAVLHNNGDATFVVADQLPNLYGQLVAADLDGDRAPDLLLVNYGDHAIYVAANLPGAGWQAPVTIPLAYIPNSIAVADFNRDQRLDVMVAVLGSGLSLFTRTADSRFEPAGAIPLEGKGGALVAGADLDGDGNLDVVVSSEVPTPVLQILWRDAAGAVVDTTTLTPPPAGNGGPLAVGDVDGDGDPDIVIANHSFSLATAHVFDNLGGRRFADPYAVPLDASVNWLSIADVDGDGHSDLVAIGSDVVVARGRGAAHFGAPSHYLGYTPSVSVADLDGDGRLDLAAAGVGSPPMILRNLGDTFDAPLLLPGGEGTSHHAVGDIDGDGDLDVAIVSEQSHDVFVYRNDGHDEFTPIGRYEVGDTPVAIAIADLNGDQRPEILTANRLSHDLSILPNRGGTFDTAQRLDVFTDPNDIAVGDLTGDGRADIAVARYGSRGIAIMEGQPDGSFAGAANLATTGYPSGVIVIDIDGDGDLDIVAVADPTQVWLNHGATRFTAGPPIAFTGAPGAVIAADLRGTGVFDLIGATPDAMQIARGRGDGTFVAPESIPFDLFTYGRIAAADLDGDGDRDLLVSRAAFDSRLAFFPNLGDGSFGPMQTWELNRPPATLLAADLDGDGRADVSYADDGVVVLRNLSPPATAVDCDHDLVPDACQPGPSRCAHCVGDCNGDGQVSIAELVVGVTIVLDQRPISACADLDRSLDGRVAINELIAAVRAALGDC